MSSRARRAKNKRQAEHSGRRRRIAAILAIVTLIGIAAAWQVSWRRAGRLAAVPSVEVQDSEIATALKRARSAVIASRDSADAWGRYGMLLMAHKFHREAVACFLEAEKRNPREPRWPYFRAISVLAWDPEAALPVLARAAELTGEAPAAPRLRLADLFLERGRFDEAKKHLTSLAVRHGEQPHVLLSLGRLALGEGRLREALPYLERSAKQLQTARGSNALMATIQQRLGNSLAAEEAARQAASMPPDTSIPDPWLDEVSVLQTGMQAWLTQADRLQKNGAAREALALLERAVTTYPDSAIAWQMLGQARLDQRNYANAENALRKAVELAPGSSANHYQLGTALFSQNQFREAADSFRRSIALRPDFARAYFNLGTCLARDGRRAEAIEEFRTAIRCDPNFGDAHKQLGATLVLEQRFEEAVDPLRRAVELNPRDRAAAEMLEQISTRVRKEQ